MGLLPTFPMSLKRRDRPRREGSRWSSRAPTPAPDGPRRPGEGDEGVAEGTQVACGSRLPRTTGPEAPNNAGRRTTDEADGGWRPSPPRVCGDQRVGAASVWGLRHQTRNGCTDAQRCLREKRPWKQGKTTGRWLEVGAGACRNAELCERCYVRACAAIYVGGCCRCTGLQGACFGGGCVPYSQPQLLKARDSKPGAAPAHAPAPGRRPQHIAWPRTTGGHWLDAVSIYLPPCVLRA